MLTNKMNLPEPIYNALKSDYQKKEIWKDVVGYEGLYQVSNYGRVKSLNYSNQYKSFVRNRILKLSTNHKGYVCVSIGYKPRRTCTVHRLVAQAFIPNPNKLPQVNHKDGNKQNNVVSNLEWCDNDFNMNHAKINGLLNGRTNKLKKQIEQYSLNDEFISKWASAKDVYQTLKISSSHIRECCRGERKTAGGFKWRNADENN